MTGRIPLSLAMLVAGAALLGASAVASPRAETPRGGTLRIGSRSDVTVDPALGYDSSSWLISHATCAKLFDYRAEPGKAGTRLVPEVVDRFTVSNDGRIYTFALKDTFRFHTGVRVTARSFADAFNRLAQPSLKSPAVSYLREIVGASPVIDGQAKSISGVRVLGRYRLELRLTKVLPDLPARLTMPFFCPILPGTPIDSAGIGNPAGSGPYYVAERIVNQRIRLERNAFYRGNRPANVDRITWTIGAGLSECRAAVEEDRIDFCGEPSAPDTAWRELADRYGVNRPGGQLFVTPGFATWFYAFNHKRPAFAGPGQIALKQAINYAIDRPALVRTFGHLAGKRTDQLLPPAFAAAESIYPLGGARPAAARRWYARARVKPTRLVLYAFNITPAVAQAQILAFNLKQLGIDLEVKYFDFDAVYEKVRTPDEPFDLVLLGWSPDFPDASGFFVPLLGGQGPLALAVDVASIRRRVSATSRLAGGSRSRAWAALDVELMRDDPPWAPFAHTQRRFFVSRSLGCFHDHPILGVEITMLCKKP